MKKRIVISVSNDLSYDQRMQRHALCLCEAGFDVLLLGRELPHSIPLKQMPFQQFRLKCWFNKGKLFYLEFQIRLFWFLLFKPATILLAVDLDTLLPNFIAARLKGSKLVHDAHEYFVEVPELSNRRVSRFFWDSIGNACIEQCNVAYTVGEELALELSKRYAMPFQTIRNLPLLGNFNHAVQTNNPLPVILYQGALNEGRALEPLIVAMHQLNAILWIVGEGDLSSKLRAMVKAEQLEEKVKFWGFVEPQALKQITLQANIAYNLLEPQGLSYQLSLANKFFDYIHAGVPQLCANFIAYQKINEKFQVALLLNTQTHAIVSAVDQLLTNKALYQTLKDNCKQAAKVYNLENESVLLRQIYHQLCN